MRAEDFNSALALKAQAGDREAADRLYRGVRALIYQFVRNAKKRTKASTDDLMELANEGFLLAVTDFNPDAATFNTYLGLKVKQELRRIHRRFRKEAGINVNDNEGIPKHFTVAPETWIILAERIGDRHDYESDAIANIQLTTVLASCTEKQRETLVGILEHGTAYSAANGSRAKNQTMYDQRKRIADKNRYLLTA